MMKKRLFPLIAYMVAIALMFTTVCATGVSVFADDEVVEDDSEEEAEEEEEDDGEDEVMPEVENFRATKVSKTSATFKWDKADDVDGYVLAYKKAGASKWIEIEVKKTSYTVKDLKMKTKYQFKIRTYVFYEEDDSEEEADEIDETAADLTTDTGEVVEDDAEEEEDEEEGSDYDYGEWSDIIKITTADKNGKGASKGDVAGSTKSSVSANGVKVKAVKKFTVKYDKKKKVVVVKWGKSSNAKKYVVYASLKKDKGFGKIGTVKAGKTLKIESKKLKKAGKTYYVKIRAINGKAHTDSKAKSVKIPKK